MRGSILSTHAMLMEVHRQMEVVLQSLSRPCAGWCNAYRGGYRFGFIRRVAIRTFSRRRVRFATSYVDKNAQRTKLKERLTHPVSPVASIVTICLAVEIVHDSRRPSACPQGTRAKVKATSSVVDEGKFKAEVWICVMGT